MAQKVTVQLVDDLDGTAADDISTVTFALDGVSYEIDLTEANAERLREELQDYVAAARRTGGRVKRRSAGGASSASQTNREHTKAVRDWARNNGFDLAERGRIPANVIEAYEQAHAPAPKGKRSKSK